MRDDKGKFDSYSRIWLNFFRGSAEERPQVAPTALPLFLPSYGESACTRLQVFFFCWGGSK